MLRKGLLSKKVISYVKAGTPAAVNHFKEKKVAQDIILG